jgi:isopropylmalate/homocitrate/citramalate synthase
MKERLIIFDTTMRDGEQSPGASMTREEKLRMARQLERMRVDVIEAGFPAASDGDFEAVRAVASAVKESVVCGLARANEQDVRRCGEAVRPARMPRVHTFLATSPILALFKVDLKWSRSSPKIMNYQFVNPRHSSLQRTSSGLHRSITSSPQRLRFPT